MKDFEFQYAEAKLPSLRQIGGQHPGGTLSASAEARGIDLKRRKSNYLSLRFSA